MAKRYPDIFRDTDKGPMHSLMCFGCDCGDGWFKLIDDLCAYITQLREQRQLIFVKKELRVESPSGYDNNILEVPSPKAVFDQVKEKFGTLRVYFHVESEPLETVKGGDRIDLADYNKVVHQFDKAVYSATNYVEFLSSRTCEKTGNPGKLHSKWGWVKTLSPEEAAKDGQYKPCED